MKSFYSKMYILLIILTFFNISKAVYPVYAAETVTDQVFMKRLKNAQNRFKDGEYFAGNDGKGVNLAKTNTEFLCTGYSYYDQVPCKIHGYCGYGSGCSCSCGTYYYGGHARCWQCWAFACQVGYDIFETDPFKGWNLDTDVNKLKAGDIVRFSWNENSFSPHSIFVLRIENNTVYYADSNYSGPCKVNWNNSVDKNRLQQYINNGLRTETQRECGVYHAPNSYVSERPAETPEPKLVLNKTELSIYEGESFQLQAVTSGTEGTVKWTSSDADIVSVSKNGIVKGKKKGEAIIKAVVSGLHAECKVNVKSIPLSIKLTTPSEIKLNIGDAYKIGIQTTGFKGTVLWNSSDKKIVSVANDGTVKAKKKGTATITAVLGSNTKKKVTCNVIVYKPSLKLNTNSICITEGDSKTIKATVSGATTKVSWDSSDKTVAIVKNGKITGKKPGKTTIVVSSNGLVQKCNVTVEKKKSIKLNKTSLKMIIDDQVKLTASLEGLTGNIKWKSTNKNVATVNNGVVTAIKGGTTTITASCSGYSASCYVKVWSFDWKMIYNNFMSETRQTSTSFGSYIAESFALYDFNNDGISELITKGGGQMDYIKIYSIKEESLEEIWWGSGFTLYSNGVFESIFHNASADDSYNLHTFRKLDSSLKFKDLYRYADWYAKKEWSQGENCYNNDSERVSKIIIIQNVDAIIGSSKVVSIKYYENNIINRMKYLA